MIRLTLAVPRSFGRALLQGLLLLGLAPAALAQPVFSKVFTPDTIGPGSASRLTFTIDNSFGQATTGLAFTDVLPAGVTLATPAAPATTCVEPVLSAPDGGSTITLSDGKVGLGATCTVSVYVTSSTPGTHMNVSGALSSSAGSSGTATDDLTVATDRPSFTKSFSPSAIQFGARSTLTFTVDNTANTGLASMLAFTDALPPTIALADPPNASNTCGGTLTAPAGGGSVALSSGSVGAGATCTISVDVSGTGTGTAFNATSNLTSTPGLGSDSSGLAVDSLDVAIDSLALIKAFLADPVPPGGTVDLEFTILNRDRNFGATNVTFTDDLDATLSGLVATGLPVNDVCGLGSQLSGTSTLTLTGGNLPAQGSCTFSVTLQVPVGAMAGVYSNTTSNINADVGGGPVVGSPATESLFVQPVPVLTKTFLGDPIGAGQTVTLEFTVTNTAPGFGATNIAFIDELTTILPFPIVAALPPTPDPPCGGGSTLTLIGLGIDRQALSLAGGNLGAGASCTFSVDLTLPAGLAAGVYTNTTEAITADVNGTTYTGLPATDDLTVVAAPQLTKEFTDDPVAPGGVATLQFTLSYGAESPADATAVAFTDDLNAALTGLTASLVMPMNDLCGPGNGSIVGTTSLTFSGATLTPGQVCQFSVPVTVPMSASPGLHTNTTTAVTATVLGVATTGNVAAGDLLVAGLELSKSFTDDPVIAGGTVNLQFTIDNTSPMTGATSITFSDTVSGALSGLTIDPASVPVTPCGAGSMVTLQSANTRLLLTGGNLLSGVSCTFSVTLNVPASAADAAYQNVTNSFSATMGGATVVFPNATDDLVVDSTRLSLSKSFTDDPVPAGGVGTLQFTLTNLDSTQGASSIAFTDDLDAALTGLTTTGMLPPGGFCGGSSTITGGSTISVTGASLAAGASCVFSVQVLVPGVAALGATGLNTTSGVTGQIGGLNVVGQPASDILRVSFLSFTKAFDGPTVAGGTPTLTFTIQNASATETVSGFAFLDDLSAVLTGLQATGLPLNDVCGSGSVISGTTNLLFSGGSLGPMSSCDIPVPLQVPGGATAGTYPNTTSDLVVSGLGVTNPAVADMVVEPPPAFAKAFAPDPINEGEVSTLTFTIDNTAATLAATALDFTDNLPAGLVVATTPNASTTCTGGTITAVAGAGVISYSGGTVAAGATCTVAVDVTGATAGGYANTTGDLTSSSGNSGTAADTLTIDDVTPPQVSGVNSVADTGDGALVECEPARVLISQLLVTFDSAMNDPGGDTDPADVTNPANYRLVGAGTDGDLATNSCTGPVDPSDRAVSVDSVSYASGSFTATLSVNGGAALPDDVYRLFACGTLEDTGGNPLDGDGNATGGDDFVRSFRVDRENLFDNGHLDCALDSWQITPMAGIVYDAQDPFSSSVSGSALVTNPNSLVTSGFSQCVTTTAPGVVLSGQLRVDTTGVVATLLCRLHDVPSCAGAPSSTVSVGSVTLDKGGTPGAWVSFSGEIDLSGGVGSLSCGAEFVSGAATAFTAFTDELSLEEQAAFRIFRAAVPPAEPERPAAPGTAVAGDEDLLREE